MIVLLKDDYQVGLDKAKQAQTNSDLNSALSGEEDKKTRRFVIDLHTYIHTHTNTHTHTYTITYIHTYICIFIV